MAWVSAFAVGWSLFQVWAVVFGPLDSLVVRPVHVLWAAALTFLLRPGFRRNPDGAVGWSDLVCATASAATCLYILSQHERILYRIAYVDAVHPLDYFFAFLALVLLLEACRRLVGVSLSLVALAFIVYAFLGRYAPGVLAHRGISLRHFVELQFLSTDGLFGLPTGVSADMVFYFIMFGSFLERSGGGQLFTDLAMAMTARMRGGPAKAAVLSSSLFGTISGTAVGNVLVTGSFTIPLMKRTGFPSHIAGAVEAVSSTGGQLMPPIMGAAAFLMAQIIGEPYSFVVVAAILPAVLFYFSLFVSVDLEARKQGIRAGSSGPNPLFWSDVWGRIHLVLGLIYLVYLVFTGYSLGASGIRAAAAVALLSVFRARTRMRPRQWWDALVATAREAMVIAVPSAVAAGIVGLIVYSGLGLKLTELLVEWSDTSLLVALVFVALACIVMGMGMPTAAAYLLVAVLMAPALIQLGISAIAAHMFVFYFAILSMVTPPVALAAYAAAGLAQSNLWQTGLTAFRLSFAAFLVPFAFINNPALLFQGVWYEIVWVSVTAALGIMALAGFLVGYCFRSLSYLHRGLLAVASVLLIAPEEMTDLVGALLFLGVLTRDFVAFRRERVHNAVKPFSSP